MRSLPAIRLAVLVRRSSGGTRTIGQQAKKRVVLHSFMRRGSPAVHCRVSMIERSESCRDDKKLSDLEKFMIFDLEVHMKALIINAPDDNHFCRPYRTLEEIDLPYTWG